MQNFVLCEGMFSNNNVTFAFEESVLLT